MQNAGDSLKHEEKGNVCSEIGGINSCIGMELILCHPT